MDESVVLSLTLDQIGDRYGRYRLHQPEAEQKIAASLKRYGQISPVVVFAHAGGYELIDGFKRLAATRSVDPERRLAARLLEVDEQAAKAALLTLNRTSSRTSELEEAWVVQALVREDRLAQVEVAVLLGHTPRWVCRRLALIEKLGEEARADLRLGLLSPTAARHVARLPRGNQAELLAVARRERLSVRELDGVAGLLVGAKTAEQKRFIVEAPREALLQAGAVPTPSRDPRLSQAGVQLWSRLGSLLEMLGRLDDCLRVRGGGELTARDRIVLAPRLRRLANKAAAVGAQCRVALRDWETVA